MLSNLWYIHACRIYILPFSMCVMQFYLPLPAVYASRSKFSNNSSINLVSELRVARGIYTVVFDYILFRRLLWGGRSRRCGLLKYRRLLEIFRTIVRGKSGSVMNTAHSNIMGCK